MKNKLSISTLAFENWELSKAIQTCRDNKIHAMEIRMGFHPWSDIRLSDQIYTETRRQMEQEGIAVSDLGTSIRVTKYQEASLEELKRVSRIANLLHCTGLRVMLGNRHKRRSDPVPPIDYDGLIRWLIKADSILDQYGTQIWIETHDEFATGESQRKLLDQYPFRNIRLLWDIMHPLEAGEDPEKTLKYMGNDLVHVHIKDGLPWEDTDKSSWKYTKIGQGKVPISSIVSLILQSGYEGYFSLEWESSWREEIRGAGFEIPHMIQDFCRLMNSL